MKKAFVIYALSLASSCASAAVVSDSTAQESYAKNRRGLRLSFLPVQFAGNIGFLSTGLGFSNQSNKFLLSLLYGYSPAAVSGVDVHSITAKNNFQLAYFPLSKKETLILYTSIGINLELGGRSFFSLPDDMPDSYYDFPKSVHAILAGGLKIRRYPVNSHVLGAVEVFAEACTIDALIWYKYMSKEVRLQDIVTIAIGVHLFRK